MGDLKAQRALCRAAAAGDVNGMGAAKARGAANFDEALDFAAAKGQISVIGLLLDDAAWGATKLTPAFISAAENGEIKAMEELFRRAGQQTVILNAALLMATFRGQVEAMDLLRQWGAATGGLLFQAAGNGHLQAMLLVYQWEGRKVSASAANEALTAARQNNQTMAIKLLESWAEDPGN